MYIINPSKECLKAFSPYVIGHASFIVHQCIKQKSTGTPPLYKAKCICKGHTLFHVYFV